MSTPTGLSGSAAIALTQQYSDETSQPPAAQILTFLNRGVEEVVNRTGGIKLWAQYYTVANQPFVALASDVLDIISANFSTSGSPLTQGTLVYPMTKLPETRFFEVACGFPVVGFGPPRDYFIYQDEGQGPGFKLPAPDAAPMPAQPVLSGVSGTSAGTIQWLKITYVNNNGETTPTAAVSFTPSTTQQTQVATPPSYGSALEYNIYGSATQGGTFYLQNTSGGIAIGTNYTVPGTLVTTGTTAPTTNGASGEAQGGALNMQLYPAAMVGQVNIYYRARPQLWADTSTTSYTNLDSSAQEAVVLFAVMRVLQNRGRGAEAMQIWKPEYEEMIDRLKATLDRRTQPTSGQVRDVHSNVYAGTPWGIPV